MKKSCGIPSDFRWKLKGNLLLSHNPRNVFHEKKIFDFSIPYNKQYMKKNQHYLSYKEWLSIWINIPAFSPWITNICSYKLYVYVVSDKFKLFWGIFFDTQLLLHINRFINDIKTFATKFFASRTLNSSSWSLKMI